MKISGMIDESMDTEQMKQPAQPLGVPFQTGMATFAYYDWRSVDELLVGYLYLFYDSIPFGGTLISHYRI